MGFTGDSSGVFVAGRWLACCLQTGHAMRAYLCAVSYARREDHAIARSEIDHSPISRGIDLVGQHKADGTAYTVEHLFIIMAMHSITFAGSVRPAVGFQSIALHALVSIL